MGTNWAWELAVMLLSLLVVVNLLLLLLKRDDSSWLMGSRQLHGKRSSLSPPIIRSTSISILDTIHNLWQFQDDEMLEWVHPIQIVVLRYGQERVLLHSCIFVDSITRPSVSEPSVLYFLQDQLRHSTRITRQSDTMLDPI